MNNMTLLAIFTFNKDYLRKVYLTLIFKKSKYVGFSKFEENLLKNFQGKIQIRIHQLQYEFSNDIISSGLD